MELIERIQYIMKLNQMNSSTFADEIGVQRSSISHVLSGRNKPSLEFIQKVISRFPKVDPSWLINGTTSISKKEEIQEPHEVQSSKKEKIFSHSNSKRKEISRILVFYADQTFEEFRPSAS